MKLKLSAIAVFAAAALSAGASQASAGYSFTLLGGPVGSESAGAAINDLGQVAGSYTTADGSVHAAVWNGAVRTELGQQLGGHGATAINNAGVVVGYSNSTSTWNAYHPTQWKGGTTSDLNPGGFGFAAAINNAGVVVGQSSTAVGASARATLWRDGVQTELGTIPGQGNSSAAAINDAGLVVGTSYLSNLSYGMDGERATLWNGTTATDLGTLGGKDSNAYAINNSGMVVGFSNTYTYSLHATLWSGSSITDLGTLAGGSYSIAYGINDAGLAVGFSDSALGGRATLWKDGVAIDLNSYLDPAAIGEGWVLTDAWGINENGWIAGTARNGALGGSRAFVLSVSAVPEPETYAMLLAGLGLMGFVARRQRRA